MGFNVFLSAGELDKLEESKESFQIQLDDLVEGLKEL